MCIIAENREDFYVGPFVHRKAINKKFSNKDGINYEKNHLQERV